MKFYLCKYIPPRTDFLATMTAEESNWMKQHGDFLNNLLDKGLIVAHGPVMDPSGGYGWRSTRFPMIRTSRPSPRRTPS